MEIGNYRFTSKSLTLLIISLILFPITANIFLNSYQSMKYYQNLSEGLILHHSRNYGEAQFFLRKALEIKDGETETMALLAKTLLLKGEPKKALVVYQEIAEFGFGEESVTGELGIIMCTLKLNADKKQRKNITLFQSMNNKLKLLEQDYPEISDIKICRGHLYLLQALVHKSNNNKQKEVSYIDLAEEKFKKAKNSNHNSPSLMSSVSLYFGLASIDYWRSMNLLEKTPEPKKGSSQANKIFKKALSANEKFYAAQLYRMAEYPNILINTALSFDHILSFSWLTKKQKQQVLTKANNYLKSTRSFQRQLRTETQNVKKINSIWKIDKSNSYVHHALGTMFLYNAQYLKSQKSFRVAEKNAVASAKRNKYYARVKQIEENSKTKINPNTLKIFRSDYIRSVTVLLQNTSFSNADTKYLTNFLALLHFSRIIRATADRVLKKLEKKLSLFPDEIINISGKKRSTIRILRHNLYQLYIGQKSSILKKQAKKYKKYIISE